jgi:aminocarboxymuconate-semialdehyde decarboxylase
VRIDFHTHFVPPLPDFAQRYGDPRWPTFEIDGSVGRLARDGVVVRTVPPSSWHPESRLADMDPAGVDVQVVSPIPPLICDWADPEPTSQWCLRLNEGIAHAVAQVPGRFRGLGTVPIAHPGRAVSSTTLTCRSSSPPRRNCGCWCSSTRSSSARRRSGHPGSAGRR